MVFYLNKLFKNFQKLNLGAGCSSAVSSLAKLFISVSE